MDDSNYEISEEAAPKKKKVSGKVARMRNLAQYKDLSDDEFEAKTRDKALGIEKSQEFEIRIKKKLDEFEEDYDLSDMKINDRDALRALIQAHISLEDYEQEIFKLRSQSIDERVLFQLEKFDKIMSNLRADISKLQNDLNITRKIRKSDQDVSVLAYITKLKADAKKFYESKAGYIFCPKCDLLLGTIWTLTPDDDRNRVVLHCSRKMPDGTLCGEKVVVNTKELLKNRGTNKKEITPESML